MNLIGIVELFLPLGWFSRGRYRCSACGASFGAKRSAVELLTPLLFAAVLYELSEYYPYTLAFLAAWTAFYCLLRKDPAFGVFSYLIAWLVLFALAFLALAFRFPKILRNDAEIFAIGATASLGLAFAALWLDVKLVRLTKEPEVKR